MFNSKSYYEEKYGTLTLYILTYLSILVGGERGFGYQRLGVKDQDPPQENDANGEEVSLQSILTAIQTQSQQTSAAILQINEGMEKLSEKVDYLYQEQTEMESYQETMRQDMDKLKRGKSQYVDIVKEAEENSGETRDRDVMRRLLDMLRGEKREVPEKKKYPIPTKNGNYSLNSGDERQVQTIFSQVKQKIT